MYNTHEIDLSSAHTRQELNLGHRATLIRVISFGGDVEIALAAGAPLLPITHIGQLFRPGCVDGRREGVQRIYYTNAAGSGTVKLLSSDDETDVDFSAASAGDSRIELVLATVVPRQLAASLDTSDPFLDNVDPLGGVVSGDGTAHMIYDAVNQVVGARYQIPVGAVAYSHAGARIGKYSFHLAQILNTCGITNHRGRSWYVEFADSIYTTEAGTNIIRRGFGFGEINETVVGWNKPFLGFQADRGHTDWRLRAKDITGQPLSVPLTGYSPLDIHALKLRAGQEDTIPYVEAWIDGALAHREVMPLASDLADMDTYPMNPWCGVARSLGADTVTMWGLLDGAMTLKLVYPDG